MRSICRCCGAALAAALLAGAASTAYGQSSITPGTVEATIDVGQTITISKTITLGAAGATTVDLFFLIDDTGSMGSIIGNAKAGAGTILAALPASYRFGVASYDGDPSEGVAANLAYNLHQGLTFDKTDTQAGIDAIFAGGGGDFPEANFFALEQMASTSPWRAEAQRLAVWFGDAPSHTATTTQAEAIAALQAANVKVVAFNAAGAGSGMDQDGQASAVVAGAGGVLVNSFGAGTDFVTAVQEQIEDATTVVDLIFGSSFVGTGLSLSFTCTDPLGCDDVDAGESRTFDLAITGLEPGTYSFTVFAQGIDAFETDRITVRGDIAVTPEPISMLLLGTGLAGIGAVGRRRRKNDLIT